MNEKIKDVIKEVLEDEESDDSSVFHKYIKKLDKDKLFESALKYETPQYILDISELRNRAKFFIKTFREKIPNSEFFYAFKCNDLPILIKNLKKEGFNADVASLFELKLALKLGFKKIIFSGPGKSVDELKLAIKNDVIINIDNFDEFERLKSLGKKCKVSVRVNTDNKITKTWSKFGVDISNLGKLIKEIKKSKLKLVGLHFHCSWNVNSERYVKNIKIISPYLEDIEFLDIGGGFFPEGIATLNKFSYKSEMVRMLSDYGVKVKFNENNFTMDKVDSLKKFADDISQALKKDIKIYFEPGRFISTHSTSILVKVVAVKKDCVIVDGGINLVGDFRFEEYSYVPIVNLSSFSLKFNKKTIYGPLCDPSDLWGYSYYGNGIKKGDVLCVLHQGAYTFSCAWRFIKPIAKYVVIDGKRIFIGKKEESFSERYSGCMF